MEKPELLPCPFCGEKVELVESLRRFDFMPAIECQACGAAVVGSSFESAQAIERWNRRIFQPSATVKWEEIPQTPELLAIIRAYTAEVNRRAENKMLLTGKLEGSHYAAMREINAELKI